MKLSIEEGTYFDKPRKLCTKIRDFYNSDLIKVITGVRQSAKSVILE